MTDDLLRQEGNSSGVPGLEEDRTIDWINDLHKQYFDEFTNAGKNLPQYMRKHDGDTMVVRTNLAADIAAGAVTFTIGSSDSLDASGAGVIYKNYQYDIFTYTGNSGGTVSGVSGIAFAHEKGQIVSKLYPLAADFGRMRIEKDRGEGVRVNGAGYTQVPDMPGYRQYSLWQNPSDSAWYLWLPHITSGDVIIVYDKTPTELTTTSSTLDIPSQYADHMYLVHGLKGIFKQVLDDEYVPQMERAEQLRLVTSAMNRGSTGKKVSASNAYFRGI